MDAIQKEFDKLSKKQNLSKVLQDTDRCLQLLEDAKEQIRADPANKTLILGKLQNAMNQAMEKTATSHKDIYNAQNKYGKALDKTFKTASSYSSTDFDALTGQSSLINRAIAMHLLREGQSTVADTFISEAGGEAALDIPPSLRGDFFEMYNILSAMRIQRDLEPAIRWARSKAALLEHRGSNLEFDLCRLQFVTLFLSDTTPGHQTALAYTRAEFPKFDNKHLNAIKRLMCAFVFPQIEKSPNGYGEPFADVEKRWEDVAVAFTREFCSLLGLSAQSPLYLAATAGTIALPTLLKMNSLIKQKKTEWTTQNELPVEIPLPPDYHFHSIFVCPVSKDQTTESNPPMMLPCGHVIAKESLQRLGRGGSSSTLKCPYCPRESSVQQARQVII